MTDPFEAAARREIVDYQQLGFRIHLAVYLAVNALLVGTWAVVGMGFPWPIFPILGWGIGFAAHFAAYTVVRKNRETRTALRAE